MDSAGVRIPHLTGPTCFPAQHTLVSTSLQSFLPLRISTKNCRFSSVRTEFKPGSAGLVCSSIHPLLAVQFWFVVQENTPENQTELNFGTPNFTLDLAQPLFFLFWIRASKCHCSINSPWIALKLELWAHIYSLSTCTRRLYNITSFQFHVFGTHKTLSKIKQLYPL